jgi:hypothetical protein
MLPKFQVADACFSQLNPIKINSSSPLYHSQLSFRASGEPAAFIFWLCRCVYKFSQEERSVQAGAEFYLKVEMSRNINNT